ncbi:hypothetical protein [Nocardia jejuensis]|uniref:hypothetical protein n=1 Tax=Nocardia jejuensis TaxID=328049 RepID=UPI0012F786EF|nr:hypothetical protein [Nocardia jejuensis]
MTSTCIGRIAVREHFSLDDELFGPPPAPGQVLWDTPLWLGAHSLIKNVTTFAADLAPRWADEDVGCVVSSVVDSVALLQRWNAARPPVAPVGRLRVRWSDPGVLVIEVWDARRPRPRTPELVTRGPGYRYYSMARLRVR